MSIRLLTLPQYAGSPLAPNPEDSGSFPTGKLLNRVDDRRSGQDRREDHNDWLVRHDHRLNKLERLVSETDKNISVTTATVKGLGTTMDARVQAITAGVEAIAAGQRATETSVASIALSVATCTSRISEIESLRTRGEGALWVVRLLGLSAIITFILWVIRNWKT